MALNVSATLETESQLPQLPDSVYSPEQLRALTLEIEKVMAWRGRQDAKIRSGATPQALPDFELTLELVDLLGPVEMVARMQPEQLDTWQDRLQDLARQPVTHITLAAPIPENLRHALIKWFRSQISPTALLKFEVNRNVLGGMVIRTESRILDLSFRQKLLENRDQIPEMLRRV